MTSANSPSATADEPLLTSFKLSGRWTEAIRQLWDLRDKAEIRPSEWNVVLDWLLNTEFDHRSFVAAETASALVRDRAPKAILNSINMNRGSPPDSCTTFSRATPIETEIQRGRKQKP